MHVSNWTLCRSGAAMALRGHDAKGGTIHRAVVKVEARSDRIIAFDRYEGAELTLAAPSRRIDAVVAFRTRMKMGAIELLDGDMLLPIELIERSDLIEALALLAQAGGIGALEKLGDGMAVIVNLRTREICAKPVSA